MERLCQQHIRSNGSKSYSTGPRAEASRAKERRSETTRGAAGKRELGSTVATTTATPTIATREVARPHGVSCPRDEKGRAIDFAFDDRTRHAGGIASPCGSIRPAAEAHRGALWRDARPW